MTAYEKLKDIDISKPIDELNFYRLIGDFRTGYLEHNHYEERLELHRNPVELKNEILRDLYSYYIQIQGREEMRDFDVERNSLGYVPTRIMELWRADKRIRSLYNAIKKYCELTAKNFTLIAVHMAECRSVDKLIGKMQRSLYKKPGIKLGMEAERKKDVKKGRVRIPNKVKAELQKEINSKCPFCANTDVGHFEIHHIDEVPTNNERLNLILLCPTCHSKITKGDISQAEVVKKKNELQSKTAIDKHERPKTINFNSNVANAIVGDHNVINVTPSTKNIKAKISSGLHRF